MRHRRRLRTILIGTALSALLAPPRPAAARVGPLDLDPARLPWSLETVFRFLQPEPGSVQYAPGLVDVDGDGTPELVVAERTKIIAYEQDAGFVKPRWQHNLEDGWQLDPRAPALGAAVDVDGDGVAEIPYTVTAADRSAWRYRLFSPARGAVLADAPLPVFPGPRKEPWWDGHYHVAGLLDDPAGDGRPAVLLVREVMYDAEPRGLVAVDAATGAVVWEWRCGPNPAQGSTRIADLDGDGTQEIVVYGNAPDNLGGRTVGGSSDDRARLFVLSARGELLIDRVIGPERFYGNVRTADLDGDGRREIITYSCAGTPGVSNVLAVRGGADGAVLAQVRAVPMFSGLAVVPGPRPGTSWLVSGTNDGSVRRFLYDGVSLTEDRRRLTDTGGCFVVGAADVLPGGGPEVVVDIDSGAALAILGPDLQPLAVGRDLLQVQALLTEPWQEGLIATASNHDGHVLRPRHRSLWTRYGPEFGRPALAAAVLAAAFAGGLLLGRRRRGRQPPPAMPGQPDRHRLRTVLEDLQETGHGTLGATKALRRLMMLATAGGGLDEPAVRERFDHLRDEIRGSVLDRLRGIVAAAREASFAPAAVDAAGAALERFAGRLAAPADGPPPDAAALAALRRDQERVEAAFGDLRREVVSYFTTDPARMLQGMLLVREVDLGRQGIAAGLDAPAAAPCLIDGTDLRFVLDNLLDNAVRALADAPERRLETAVTVRGREVTVTVRDTGPGVPPDLRERIFSGRHSSRRGGGLGLARSRRLLARWGGELLLAEPQPDPGACFVVRLPALRD